MVEGGDKRGEKRKLRHKEEVEERAGWVEGK